MLFQFFRLQLQRERPTISSTVRRENGQVDIGGTMRVEVVNGVSSRSAAPVVTVKERPGSTAKKA